MNLEQKRRKILEELGYSDSEVREILNEMADPANLDEYGAFPFEEEEECFEHKWRKTADELFDDMHKKLGRIPTLQEFIETTGYSKTSYYKARQKYKLGLEIDKRIKESEERYAMAKNKNKHRR